MILSRAFVLRALSILMFAAAIWFAFVAAVAGEFGARLVAGIVAVIFASFGGALVSLRVSGEEENSK